MNNQIKQNKFAKYLIFLPNRFDTSTVNVGCIRSKKKKPQLINNLNDKGISIKFMRDIRNIVTNNEYSFDDLNIPKLNKLYIHLFNGNYYSDDLFTRKKTEREREILFLLAMILGVKSITYETEVTETTIKSISANITFNDIGIDSKFNKSISKSKGESGKETFLDRGSPIYILSNNINQVEDKIKERLSNINSSFFYSKFYEKNNKLKLFVYKRYNFGIDIYEYTSTIEDHLEIIFNVKLLLAYFGLGINLDKQIIVTEKVKYKMEFYSDKELRLSLNNFVRMNEDPFSPIREVYDDEDDKEIGIYHITEYVRKFSKKCIVKYTLPKNNTNNIRMNIYSDTFDKRLEGWIKDNTIEKFKEECRKFTSSYQIKTWFKSELMLPNETIIEDDYDINNDPSNENYGILKLQKLNYAKKREDILKTGKYTCLQDNSHSLPSPVRTIYNPSLSPVSRRRSPRTPSPSFQRRNRNRTSRH